MIYVLLRANRKAQKYDIVYNALRTMQCSHCTTDLCFEATVKPGEVFASLEAYVWKDLGPRGDHDTMHWRSLTVHGNTGPSFSRSDSFTGYSFGDKSLQEVWRETEGFEGCEPATVE